MNFQKWDRYGDMLVGVFHRITLFAIGAATVWAAGFTVFDIFLNKRHASIQDLLLLFIFLEIGAMVGIYFKTNHMPIRFLIYIAITALTRHTVDLVTHSGDSVWEIAVMGGTTFLLALSVYVIRMASHRFPSGSPLDNG
jgi:phosphate starvation-inducible membrane PsiE